MKFDLVRKTDLIPISFNMQSSFLMRHWILFVALWVMTSTWTLADDLTQITSEPPIIYREQLSKLLTPLDAVLKRKDEYTRLHGDSGICLLDEKVAFVNPDGKLVTAFHTINLALNDAGARAISKGDFYYKKKTHRIYLALAQSIQPDGTRDRVKNDALFLKTPESEEGNDIYDDELELDMVYSDIKPGSITENIVVQEETDTIIPGQFSDMYGWVSSWPEFLERYLLVAPNSLIDKLKITSLGQGVPTYARTDFGKDNQLLTWEKSNVAPDTEDSSEPPSDQVGPLVWVSSLDSWDAMAKWYSGEIAKTVTLSADFKAKIDDWTKGVTEPGEIIRILLSHVARDVRYTGFELGRASFCPHDCMSVWQRQYGDCKDKANLLRAMLSYKGIPAWLTLLSTDHAGAVNRENPGVHQFNHCILNTMIGGQSIFCDPTITYAVPGLLDGSESDRDVLVIKDDHADWQHTPAFKDAKVLYSFDLQLRPNGDLSGWVELNATGYYATYYRRLYTTISKQDGLSRYQQCIQYFYPNSAVVDIALNETKQDPLATTPAPFSVRGYMTLPGVIDQGATSGEIRFPDPTGILPDFTNYKDRLHTTFMWPDEKEVKVKIQLPEGWTAPSLPTPHAIDTELANYHCEWTNGISDKPTTSNVTADFNAIIKKSLYQADEWHTLGDASTKMVAWGSKSLAISKANSASGGAFLAKTTSDQDLADQLPIMPTGDGQLNLIDQDFPSNGNVVARRAALAKIANLFPADTKSIMQAAIDISNLDLNQGDWQQVIDRLQPLLAANQAVLDPDLRAFGQYDIAAALKGEGKVKEARALYLKIIEDKQVNPDSKGWATYRLAKLLAESSPKAGLDCVENGLGLATQASPALYSFYASTAITLHETVRLKRSLARLIAAKPDNLHDILGAIADEAKSFLQSGQKDKALALVEVINSVWKSTDSNDAVAQELTAVKDHADAFSVYAKIQTELQKALPTFPEMVALEKKQPAFASIEEAGKAAQDYNDKNDAPNAMGASLRELDFPVDDQFPERLWDFFRFSQWYKRVNPSPGAESFFNKVYDVSGELPRSCSDYYEIQILKAKTDEQMDQRVDASKLYEVLLKEPKLPDSFLGPLALRNGQNYEEQNDYDHALASYLLAEKTVNVQSTAQDAVIRAAFIQFDNGNLPEALRLINLLSDAAKAGKIKPEEQIHDIIEVSQADTKQMPLYWDNWHNWWADWQKIEANEGLKPVVAPQKVMPRIESMKQLGAVLGTSLRNHDAVNCFEIARKGAYAARVYPNAAINFLSTFSLLSELSPNEVVPLRHLTIEILEKMDIKDPLEKKQRLILLMANYFDNDQAEAAEKVMLQEWTPEMEDGSMQAMAMHRVWALIAIHLHRKLDPVKAALENDLKLDASVNRAITVNSLADVYLSMGHAPEAITLISNELKNPALTDSAGLKALQARLDQIISASQGSELLAAGVNTWLQTHKPEWWDYAEPKDSNDPRMARIDDLLDHPQGQFTPAELIKIGLMAPQVSSLSIQSQTDDVAKAFELYSKSLKTQPEVDQLLQDILNNVSFNQKFKQQVYLRLLGDAFDSQNYAVYLRMQQMPIFQDVVKISPAFLRLNPYASLDHSSTASILEFIKTTAAKPTVDKMDLDLINEGARELIRDQDIASAQQVADLIQSLNFDSSITDDKTGYQLDILKSIRQAKDYLPINVALKKIVFDKYKPETISKPDGFDDRRNKYNLSDLSAKDALAYELYQLKIDRAPLTLSFWKEFMRHVRTEDHDLVFSLLQSGFNSTSDDELVSALILFGSYVFDIDQPELRKRFSDLIKPYSDPTKYPHSSEAIRLFITKVAIRTGAPVNLESDLTGFSYGADSYVATSMKLHALLQSGSIPKLKEFLNNTSTEDLIKSGLKIDAMRAFDLVGMPDEAKLCRNSLEKDLHQDILEAWVTGDFSDIEGVESDLEALGTLNEVPPDFINFVIHKSKNSFAIYRMQELVAKLSKDWPGLLSAANQYLRDYPTYYTNYLYVGKSQYELGNKVEAIKALTIYCNYSHDELDFIEAKALLDKLQAGN